jgi:hypothetical protein
MRTNQETTRNDQVSNALLNESFGPETQNGMPFGNEADLGALSPTSPLIPPESESGQTQYQKISVLNAKNLFNYEDKSPKNRKPLHQIM